jgi:hypothetical protein
MKHPIFSKNNEWHNPNIDHNNPFDQVMLKSELTNPFRNFMAYQIDIVYKMMIFESIG